MSCFYIYTLIFFFKKSILISTVAKTKRKDNGVNRQLLFVGYIAIVYYAIGSTVFLH